MMYEFSELHEPKQSESLWSPSMIMHRYPTRTEPLFGPRPRGAWDKNDACINVNNNNSSNITTTAATLFYEVKTL